MAECKDCLHYELCKHNTYQEAKYFGKDMKIYITIDNNTACKFFKPTADVVEVKHGYFKETTEPLGARDVSCVECSVCGDSWIIEEDYSIEDYEMYWHYCPNCGAKMDKRGDTE